MFGKKKEAKEAQDQSEEEKKPEQPSESQSSGSATLPQIMADLDKLKAQFSTFFEINKAATERFSRLNEQIGELRSMQLEHDKEGKMLEAKAMQAIDMVQTVQPDKLMIEMRKSDAKVEALRGNLESNEFILKSAINEMKDMRTKMRTFTGLEQVIKMSDEVKAELTEIRKMSAVLERHGDKVETIFTEMQKRFSDFMKFSDSLRDVEKNTKQVAVDLDGIKARVTNFAAKKDVEDMVAKYNSFEKHVTGLMSLISRKFESLEKDSKDKFEVRMAKVEKLLSGFEMLAKKTPDLDKYFHLLEEEAKKAPAAPGTPVEKIKVPGQEEKEPEAKKEQGLLGKIKDKLAPAADAGKKVEKK